MRFSGYAKPYKISGDYGERDPPVPMPNTEVKPFSADGTWLETTWESRTLPDSMKKGLTPNGMGSFFIPSATSLHSGYLCSSQRTYLVRIFPAARSAGCRQEKSPGRVGERKRKKHFSFRLQCPYFLVIFYQVRERTWLDSSLRQCRGARSMSQRGVYGKERDNACRHYNMNF